MVENPILLGNDGTLFTAGLRLWQAFLKMLQDLGRPYDEACDSLCAGLQSSAAIQLLRVLILAFRPLSVLELVALSALTKDSRKSRDLIDHCSILSSLDLKAALSTLALCTNQLEKT